MGLATLQLSSLKVRNYKTWPVRYFNSFYPSSLDLKIKWGVLKDNSFIKLKFNTDCAVSRDHLSSLQGPRSCESSLRNAHSILLTFVMSIVIPSPGIYNYTQSLHSTHHRTPDRPPLHLLYPLLTPIHPTPLLPRLTLHSFWPLDPIPSALSHPHTLPAPLSTPPLLRPALHP